MINRKDNQELVLAALKRTRIVALLGPRQSGKTTLARQFVPTDLPNYFDLEDPQSPALVRTEYGVVPAEAVGRDR